MPSNEAIILIESILNEVVSSSTDKNTCSCCGKKQGYFKSFSNYKIGNNKYSLCSYCGDILYAIKGAKKENNKDAELELKAEIEKRMKKGGNKNFQDWYKEEF